MRFRFAVGLLAALACLTSASADAQGLRDRISSLFIFGPGEDPLFLAGSADPSNPAFIQAHGTHFVPASAAENASLITFVTGAIGANIGNTPIGSTSGAETFRFEGGVPVRTSESAGPVFAERAQTLGRGRLLAGLSRSTFSFATLRGVDLNDIQLTFTHENVDFPNCDSLFGGDCSRMGVPAFENDVMEFNLALDIDVAVTAFYLTYGLSDRLDIGAVLPIVSATMRGESRAQLVPFGPNNVAHFFDGTAADPDLAVTRTTSGSATGLGDVALRLQASFGGSRTTAIAVLADARFPTGSEQDLLGSGEFSARGLAVFTSRFGAFSPHANLGYLYRGGDNRTDAVLATVGFDHLLGRRVTLAADLINELQVGDPRLSIPRPVEYEAPFARTVRPTSIPERRDDYINGSFGFKIVPADGLTALVNALFPLNRGGLRPDIIYTAGIEYSF
jgi:hypothetical protein